MNGMSTSSGPGDPGGWSPGATPDPDSAPSANTRRRNSRYLPGFDEMARRRSSLTEALVARRVALGLSQTEVAARMGTSQSAVARLEAGSSDVRLSSLERYASAVEQVLDWRLGEPGAP
jgi:ribosome-binding protein aMBF1 (putative translation factor)